MNEMVEQAHAVIKALQTRFVSGLEALSGEAFVKTEWQRAGGTCGGGNRYGSADNATFNRASVNFSHVHYDSDPSKKLSSATALSTIIHPANPHAPSVHMHISWTEMKNARNGYWRIMADLNPAIENKEDTSLFLETLEYAAPDNFEEGAAQGERYFFIPALERHRGVAHFYLEQFSTGKMHADLRMAEAFGQAIIDRYLQIFSVRNKESYSEADSNAQLAYHTLYLLQVLTLDRGTTSGLLVHDENDLGIMGSLPSRVDVDLLASWRGLLPTPQDELLDELLACLRPSGEVTDQVRVCLAKAVRSHYQKHPHALALQASGFKIPPTVANHRG